TLSADNLGLGGNATDRPNIVSAISYPKTASAWFNAAAFALPAPLAWGDAQEGAIRGPGRFNFNLSMYKDFQMPFPGNEGSRLRFAADFYNAFNHTQFHDVNTTL